MSFFLFLDRLYKNSIRGRYESFVKLNVLKSRWFRSLQNFRSNSFSPEKRAQLQPVPVCGCLFCVAVDKSVRRAADGTHGGVGCDEALLQDSGFLPATGHTQTLQLTHLLAQHVGQRTHSADCTYTQEHNSSRINAEERGFVSLFSFPYSDELLYNENWS